MPQHLTISELNIVNISNALFAAIGPKRRFKNLFLPFSGQKMGYLVHKQNMVTHPVTDEKIFADDFS